MPLKEFIFPLASKKQVLLFPIIEFIYGDSFRGSILFSFSNFFSKEEANS